MARKFILILFALIITGSTVWFVRNWAGNQKPHTVETAAVEKAPVIQNIKILVAAADLPAGTLVQEQHLKWQAWPEDDDLDEIYIVENKRPLEDFIGTVVRQGVVTGEPVTDARLVKPGQAGFLAAVLNPGKRAVSIPVDMTTGIAGFVFPGDRVDVILTHSLVKESEVEGDGTGSRRASETILTDVRVVAMDQSTNDQVKEASVSRVATLEVTPKGAEIVAVATQLGRLTLSLRALARIEDEAKSKNGEVAFKDERGRGHTWDSEASRLITGGTPRTGIPTTVINVVRAGEAKQKLFD
ncbi:MAG: Flp pilus assembly protein CpaB [Sneathiella sp.]|jgi:pilus assembly protein CpaB|uniref:Flp pilus assembly protein CpaB n=1 Tax=Sneathiella sp. TaxID=1964365 RepID=UPI000C5A8EAF|nr:Flp pilus assembly protein CpaB [Sneathiella sp.]MAL78359.1 Flp pilus assembly protein CpaB [Sneathiella sp.]|tara:strand:- start:831 stop:1727 length:897 start_codon:yes stop_codon:yes gene_type:complete